MAPGNRHSLTPFDTNYRNEPDTYHRPTDLCPAERLLAGAVTWLVSRRKRRNDMLADMQRSIDLLCEKYNDVLQENVTLRREKADWLVAQQELLRKIDKLTREVEGLRKNFNRKTQKNR